MDRNQKMKRGKRKTTASDRERRWSAMDTVIVMLLFVAVVGVVLRVAVAYWDAQDAGQANGVYYDVHFEVDAMFEASLDDIDGADAVYLLETGELLGYMGVEGTSADSDGEGQVSDPNGGEEAPSKKLYPRPRVEGTDPDIVAADGVICIEGKMVDGSLYSQNGEIYLSKGTELTVCTERVTFQIRVTDILSR